MVDAVRDGGGGETQGLRAGMWGIGEEGLMLSEYDFDDAHRSALTGNLDFTNFMLGFLLNNSTTPSQI